MENVSKLLFLQTADEYKQFTNITYVWSYFRYFIAYLNILISISYRMLVKLLNSYVCVIDS